MTGWTMPARLGWRNLWRNPRRSLITLSAVGVAYASLIALIGLMKGLQSQMLDNGTSLMLGHLQVHDSRYLPDRNIYDTIGGDRGVDVPHLLAQVAAQPQVLASAPRVHGFGLVSTGEQSAGVQILGVDPGAEAGVSRLLEGVAGGASLARPGGHTVLLGDGLAQELNAGPGSEIALVTQTTQGTLGNDLYRVAGILHTGLKYLDRSLVVVHLADLQELVALGPGRIHEVAVRIANPVQADALCARLNASGWLPPDATAQSWGQLLPQLRDYLSLAGAANRFIISLVALFAAFGVLNTMTMAVFERQREIGMLNSLGTSPWLILASILMESLFLALLGLGGGFGLGALSMYYMTTRGLDLRSWTGELTMLNTKVDPVLTASWAWDQVLWAAAALAAATLLAAFLPARRAARLQPAEAMRASKAG
ncbi:MAG: ABC transporter permease [Acidobacteria bacterium]|nr:ABC transporter permease [Acidobacteriota bacterium]